MKKHIILIFLASLSAIGILIFDLLIGAALNYPPIFNAPWPFALEAFLLALIVGYVSRSHGWLMGLLSMVGIYLLLFLLGLLLFVVLAIDTWRMGDSVIYLIRMNTSFYGIQQAIQTIFIWIFLPSVAIGTIGGTIGELIYKRTKKQTL